MVRFFIFWFRSVVRSRVRVVVDIFLMYGSGFSIRGLFSGYRVRISFCSISRVLVAIL